MSLKEGDYEHAAELLGRARKAPTPPEECPELAVISLVSFFVLRSSTTGPTLFERCLDGTLMDLLSPFKSVFNNVCRPWETSAMEQCSVGMQKRQLHATLLHCH
jgi:hypothetical protein